MDDGGCHKHKYHSGCYHPFSQSHNNSTIVHIFDILRHPHHDSYFLLSKNSFKTGVSSLNASSSLRELFMLADLMSI